LKILNTAKILVPYPFDNVFDYIIPDNIQLTVGDIVKVPFGKQTTIGIVWNFDKSEVIEAKLKKIEEKLDYPPLKKELLDFIKWVGTYNLIPLGSVLKMVLGVVKSFKKSKKAKEKIKSSDKLNFHLYELSKEQKEAFEFINERMEEKKHSVTVLEGATGSGKTEVYFHLIKKVLTSSSCFPQEGSEREYSSQVLILLPEIALTTQLISRFEEQFGFKPAVWHSQITSAQKRDMWKGITNSKIKVVIGARSAIFLPFKNLSLIIVDEEHEQSFKQYDNGSYNGRDMAIVRAKLNNIPIILSSATPSLETLINCEGDKNIKSKYFKINLPSRFGNSLMPTINIVDLKKEKLKRNNYISVPLIEKIHEHLENKKQVLLFLNRRGYAPIVLCASCGHKIVCPNCSITLTKHKNKQRLICHYCGYNINEPKTCPECKLSDTLIGFGMGVEKIEEEVQKYFPKAKIAIMTSDTVNTPKKSADIIEKITKNEINIIIGTQLVAKGHHFPNLTLVGILDADAGLFGGDIRAAERTYQLLTQVSGRAGREKDRGLVMLQTYTSDNLILQAIKNGNKEILIEFEKQNRKLINFPPYGKLALIVVSGRDEIKVREQIKKIVKIFPHHKDIEVMGPMPSPVAKLKSEFRYQIFIKTSRKIKLQELIKNLLGRVKIDKSLKIKIDIDPV
jgi:primosomal protein N' (replication factor Y) (superfamily II helicase)